MKTLEMNHATARLSDYARAVRREPMILTLRGRPYIALVSLKNADTETLRLSTNSRFMRLIEHSRLRYKSRGGIATSEMRRRIGRL